MASDRRQYESLKFTFSAEELQELGQKLAAESSVANLGTSISNEISAVKASIAAAAANNNGSVSAADVEAVVGQLTTLQQTVDAETAALAPQPSPGTAPAA